MIDRKKVRSFIIYASEVEIRFSDEFTVPTVLSSEPYIETIG